MSAAFVAALFIGGCDGGDVREWTPQDHDKDAKQASGMQTSGVTDDENATLLTVTWRQNCARCHGMSGRGDGPEGPMLRVPDLSRPDFQSRATDEEIANVIKKGRNKMPAFEALPPKVVSLLVQHIRSLGGR
jgi:cytochrome c oxidase cbb3-type subunit 3